jgi:uncharacterized protein YicC (UPF0701 family)
MFARVEREAAVSGGLRVDDVQLDAYLDAHERMTRRRGTHGVTVDFAGCCASRACSSRAAGKTSRSSRDRGRARGDRRRGGARAHRDARGGGRRIADVLRERVALMEAAYGRIAERAPSRLVEQRDRLRAAGARARRRRRRRRGAPRTGGRGARGPARRERGDRPVPRPRGRVPRAARRRGRGARRKRLGFLLQEMLREANTTGSKANDAGMLVEVVW